MIKHNDTNASSINVLAEGELDQVVGGCGHGHRRGGWGGWGGKRDYDKGGYDKGSYDKGGYDKGGYDTSSYEPSYDSGYDSGDNVVVNNNQNITLDINIQQVAG